MDKKTKKQFDPEKYGMMFCPDCNGNGSLLKGPDGMNVCTNCGGFGLVRKETKKTEQTNLFEFLKKPREGKIDMVKTLIVEDSVFFRQLLKEALLSRFPKMEILEAADGEEALKKITPNPPDLIFMDIKLPGESGLELTKKIKSQYPDIVIIILTSYDTPEYREAAKQYKANYFLSKGSATKESILALVESIFSNR